MKLSRKDGKSVLWLWMGEMVGGPCFPHGRGHANMMYYDAILTPWDEGGSSYQGHFKHWV